jgi:hypothetical protein
VVIALGVRLPFPLGRISSMDDASRKFQLTRFDAINQEDATPYPSLRIFSLPPSTLSSTPAAAPRLLRSVPLRPSARPSPVSTVAFPPSGAHLAVGFGDGTALLFRHIWQSLTAESSGLPKPKVLVEGNGDAVTGLMFREPRPESKAAGVASSAASSSAGKSSTSETYLFISTLARVLVHPLSKSKRAGGFPTSLGGSPDVKVLDEVAGAGLGCTAGVILPSTDREVGFAVAREEGGIVVYTPVGRGPSFALPATYSALSSLHPVPSLASTSPYSASVVVLSPPFAPSVAAASGTVRQLAKQGEKDMGRMTVLDLEMGWIAWRNSFRGGGVWGLWRNSGIGALAIGSKDGKVHPVDRLLQMLSERADKPTHTLLFRSPSCTRRPSTTSCRRCTTRRSSRSRSSSQSRAASAGRGSPTSTGGTPTGCTRRVIGRAASASTLRRSAAASRGAMSFERYVARSGETGQRGRR